MSNLIFQRLLLACVLINPGYSLACSCVENDIATHISMTPFIFTGLVMKGEVVFKKTHGNFESQPVVEYTFNLNKNYKGMNKDNFKLWTHQYSATCGVTLAIGFEYLIFAFLDKSADLQINSCSPNSSLGEGEEIIKKLEDDTHNKSFKNDRPKAAAF